MTMLKFVVVFNIIFVTIFTPVGHVYASEELTENQSKGMYRHGIWEWSIRTCPGIFRGRRYWYYLKEAAGFKNVSEISLHKNSEIYKEGWQYMQDNADKFGIDKTCDYAMAQWPALLWRQDISGTTPPVKEQEDLVKSK